MVNPCKVDFKSHDPMKEPQFSEAGDFHGDMGGVARFSSIVAHLRTMSCVIFSGSYSFFWE